MMKPEVTSLVNVVEREAGTCHPIPAAHALSQALYEGRLTAAQVAYQFDSLTAAQFTPDLLGDR